MATTDDIETLNQHIRDGSPETLEMLARLPSACTVDAAGQSPFNVAIQVGNADVVNLLLDADDALEFAPAVQPPDRAKRMKAIYNSEGIDDIELAERRVLEAVGGPPYWQRTPLLQACRYQNRGAIRKLIDRGAKPNAKDLVGETPLALCVRTGGTELARHFIGACIAADKPFPLSAEILSQLCSSTELYQQAIAHGRPNVAAKRFMFNLACATLDRGAITRMLDSGFDVSSSITEFSNPVIELVTSRLAWTHQASRWQELAAGYAHVNGHPATTAIRISNDPGPGDLTFGETQALHAKLNDSVRRKGVNPKFMSSASLQERLALLSLVLERGLDVGKVKQKLNFPLTADVISSNEPEFVAALIDAGFSLGPDDDSAIAQAIRHGCFDMVAALEQCGHRLKEKDSVPDDMLEKYRQWQSSAEASATMTKEAPPDPPSNKTPELSWELDGESVVNAEVRPDPPRAGEPCTISLRHCNLYGPRPDVRFELLVATDETAVEDDEGWQACELVSETVDIDGEEVDLASLDDAPFGETPWVGLFVAMTTLSRGSHRILIRVTGPDPAGCGTLDDWVIDVVD